jgi:hypothetical protein
MHLAREYLRQIAGAAERRHRATTEIDRNENTTGAEHLVLHSGVPAAAYTSAEDPELSAGFSRRRQLSTRDFVAADDQAALNTIGKEWGLTQNNVGLPSASMIWMLVESVGQCLPKLAARALLVRGQACNAEDRSC